ncbi:MAG: hypothetical protein LIP10_06525 [Clostridiales bacterium]|nr:hypothetical protein [Clostridiales bacterium]
MKKLIICNTYYQLILAIQMKLTLFRCDDVDVWISDSSQYADKVANRLRKCDLFVNVEYQVTKNHNFNQTAIKNISDIIAYGFRLERKPKIELYDEIIYYNLEIRLYAIDDYYRRIHHDVVWSRYEEGILSYETDLEMGNRIKLVRKLRKFTGGEDLALSVNNYYCTIPEIKVSHKEWNFIKIPSISSNNNSQLNEILNFIFDYKKEKPDQKYIYFASSSDIDGNPMGETELILKLAEKLGTENFIVKMHPRDSRTVYEEKGISVIKNSYIPWEVIQMNLAKTDLRLLTIHSGAFISISSMLEDQEINGYFLFKYVNCDTDYFKKRSQQIQSAVDRLHSVGKCLNIHTKIDFLVP